MQISWGLALAGLLGLGTADAAADQVTFDTQFGDIEVVRALGELETGDAVAAHQRLQRVLAGPAPVWPEVRFIAARAALAAGFPTQAVELLHNLDEALVETQDFVWELRARAYRAEGDWEKARATWRDILAMPRSPLHDVAAFGIADAEFGMHNLRAARAAYENAISRASRSDEAMTARYNLGRIAEMEGRFNDAAEYYRYLAYRHPSHPLHDPAEARLRFLSSSQLSSPPRFSDQLNRIDRLLSARSLEEAARWISDLSKNARTNTERFLLRYRQAQLAYRLRDYPQAVEDFGYLARGTSSWSRRIKYEEWLARTYSAAGDYDAAIKLHLQIANRKEYATTARRALFKAAWLAFNGADHPRAIKLFGQFVQAYPSDSSASDALWYLAWNAYRAGDLPTSAATFRSLRQKFPTSSLVQRAHYWEGRIATLMGRGHDAQESYAAARDFIPLTYYSAMAEQRLRELQSETSPSIPVASLTPMRPEEPTADDNPHDLLQPAADELPTAGGLRRLRQVHLPWGAAVFDWSSPDGQRAIRLLRMGLPDQAAEVVGDMDAMPGHDANDVHYARARLLWAFGDYHRAYRLVATAFASRLEDGYSPEERRYFHIAFPAAHGELVQSAAQEFGISPLLIWSLMRQESAFDHRARSWASANGLMQIIPRTGNKIAERLNMKEYNYGVLRSPAVNVRFGAWYLKELLTKFHGHPALAIGSYNAGPEAMSRWVELRGELATDEFIEEIPYRETRHYVKRVLGNLVVYSKLYGQADLTLPHSVPDTYLDNINF